MGKAQAIIEADNMPMSEDPPWMYLKGAHERAHTEFWGWANLIMWDLSCD